MPEVVHAVVRKLDDGYVAACAQPPLERRAHSIDGALLELEGALRGTRRPDEEYVYLVVSLYFGPFEDAYL